MDARDNPQQHRTLLRILDMVAIHCHDPRDLSQIMSKRVWLLVPCGGAVGWIDASDVELASWPQR